MKRSGQPLLVVSVIEGTPAEKAGLQSGDLIEVVDKVETTPLALDDVLDALRGEPGTVAQLQIIRDGKRMEVSAERQVIKTATVRLREPIPGIFYIRINQFRKGVTASEFIRKVQNALKGRTVPLTGMVLDLRASSRGSLTEMVAVASAFMPAGTPVLQTIEGDSTTSFATKASLDDGGALLPLGALQNLPRLVVLVDRGTAGLSEVLARALKANCQAKIVGKPSASADILLTSFELHGGATARLPSTQLLTASGESWDDKGVPLDLEVQDTPGVEFGGVAADVSLQRGISDFIVSKPVP